MAVWSLVITLGGQDVSSQIFGVTTIRRERNAAALARLNLRPVSGVLDQAAYIGQAITIDAQWDALPINRRFSGVVELATWDAREGLLNLSCVDGLREAMRARTTSEVLALMPGARWRTECFGPETDGWEQFREAVQTLDSSYCLQRDGVDRWISRVSKGTPDLELSAAEVLEDSVGLSAYERANLVNHVNLTVQSRGVILHHWELDASWFGYPPGYTFCDNFRYQPWWLPWQDRIISAIDKAGWRVQQRLELAGPNDDAGVRFTSLPKGDTTPCGDTWVWIMEDSDPRATAAQWVAVYRWEQTARRHYALTIQAPDAISQHGTLARSEEAGYDEGDQERGWSSGPGSQTPSGPEWTLYSGSHFQSVVLDQTESDQVLECAVAIEVARILDAYRGNKLAFEVLMLSDFFERDIGDTIRLVDVPAQGLQTTATGTLEQWEEYWDPDSGDAGLAAILGVSRCDGPGGTDDPIAAPAAPSLAPGYALDSEISFDTYVGGRAESPPLDTSWRGWITNTETITGGSEVYPQRQFAVEYPKRPLEAKQTKVGSTNATYQIYPPNDELIQTII